MTMISYETKDCLPLHGEEVTLTKNRVEMDLTENSCDSRIYRQ